MDHFHEEVVVKKNRTMDEITYYFSWVVIVISGANTLLTLMSLTRLLAQPAGVWLPPVLFAVLTGAVAVVSYLFHDRLRTEYEYTFTNGSLDFAKVYNNRSRKSLGSLNVRTVEGFGPVSGQAFQRYLSMQNVEQTRWFLNREGNLHYFYFQKESKRRLIIFEPSEELVGLIRHYLPYGVYQE